MYGVMSSAGNDSFSFFPIWIPLIYFLIWLMWLELAKLCSRKVTGVAILLFLVLGEMLSAFHQDFPGGSEGKSSAHNVGDLGSIPGSGRSPGEGNGNPLLPGKCHGWRSLVGYCQWDCKESYMTEQLHFHHWICC